MSLAEAVEIRLTHGTAAGIAGTYEQNIHKNDSIEIIFNLVIYILKAESPNKIQKKMKFFQFMI